MVIEIDFNSDEAIYVQLMNQIIMGIATSRLQEGDPLPSVRQLADTVGINMHTVNKAYSLLRQEGFVTIDLRRGAIIAVDVDKIKALEEMKENLLVALAKGCCRNVSRIEVHERDKKRAKQAVQHIGISSFLSSGFIAIPPCPISSLYPSVRSEPPPFL